jgi:hypothetical protein
MTTRADKIIEGFKLGSLGAGHSKMSYDSDLKVGNKQTNGKDYPYMFWHDPDDMKYALQFIPTKGALDDFVNLWFYGGCELSLSSGVYLCENYEFLQFSKYRMSLENAVSLIRTWIPIVKTRGIVGILDTLPKFTPNAQTYDVYKKWLAQKRKKIE